MIVVSGRPYHLDWAVSGESAPAAILQAFFPGEEGAPALASLLSGAESPSGRLPVSMPRSAGAQPYSYLHPRLGGPSEITSVDSTPVLPFGHGLGYTTFVHDRLEGDATVSTDGSFTARVRVRNTGGRAGADVVQLYARDIFASVTRPVAQLLAYQRVDLDSGEEATIEFDVPIALLGFTGRDGERIVESGEVELWVGPSSAEKETLATLVVTGPDHVLSASDRRMATSRVVRSVASV
jgi:beta-glucosidase